MFAIAFDMTVVDIVRHHPKGVPQTYRDIARTLAPFGFKGVQGSVYLTENEDLGNLVSAGLALRTLPWLAASVRDIRGFRVDHWSDFTPFVRMPQVG